jgi:hypothetical protein
MIQSSTLLGLSMVAAAVLWFVLMAPRRDQISPLLRSNGVEYALTMLMLLLLVGGGALALMGFPVVMNPAAGR